MNSSRTNERDVDLVRSLCRPDGEMEWLEYKQNNGDPEDIGRYISALSNAAALNDKPWGYLLWGVEDRTGQLVGTTFDPNTAKKGNEPLENWLLRLLQPPVSFGFRSVDVDGKRIVIGQIGRAPSVPVRFRGVDYVRVGATTRPLRDAPERERALWRMFDRAPFEGGTARERLKPEDILELLDYRVYFNLMDRPVPSARDSILTVLEADKLIGRNFAGGWDIFNLGAILLARNLDHFPGLERKAVRVVRYSGKGRSAAIREQVGTKGYAAGFAGLVDYIDALLPGNEVIEQALRKTVSMLPKAAIRELAANMLVHQDFSKTGTGPMVEIFADRIEFSNPGEPLIATNRFVDAPPRSRNEGMAALMRRFGICEERGSGIDKALDAIEFAQLPAPLFETPPEATRAVMFAHRDLKDMDRADRVRAVYFHACLRYVMREKTTNATLRQRFGIATQNAATVSRLLNDAVEAGAIAIANPDEGRRSRTYVPFWAVQNDDSGRSIV